MHASIVGRSALGVPQKRKKAPHKNIVSGQTSVCVCVCVCVFWFSVL